MCVTFDPAAFRDLFAPFANSNCYPTTTLQMWWDLATSFIDVGSSRWSMLNGQQRGSALNLLTAHIGTLFVQAANGQMPGVLTRAQIDKVSVDLQPPPESDSAFRFYMNQSPYGQQLLALLSVCSVGGFYSPGGAGARAGFRW